jgi:hypothetical protein
MGKLPLLLGGGWEKISKSRGGENRGRGAQAPLKQRYDSVSLI